VVCFISAYETINGLAADNIEALLIRVTRNSSQNRKHGEVGVWLEEVRPTQTHFSVISNQIVWRAETATQSDTLDDHVQWCDFSFGEPAVTVLPDGNLLLAFWCLLPDEQGIRYLKLKT